jgi:ubiquinone/menaquinone biosynthesis C-methylase UbiE
MGLVERYCWAPILDRIMRNPDTAKQREKVVPHAVGRVLEIGVGSGLNLSYYDRVQVSALSALEPSVPLIERAKERARSLDLDVEILRGSAEAMPFDGASFDTVVMTFTLCSIPNAAAALGEIRRVLRPGGQLLFAEHGLASDPRIASWQQRLNPLWVKFSGGCNMDRPISQILQRAGFQLEKCETAYLPGPKVLTYNYWGAAVPN